MNTIFPSRLLKLALTADATVSGAVAILQLVAAGWLSELLNLPKSLLIETGVFLAGYAILLVLLARSTTLWSLIIGVVVIGNIGWAIACAGLLAGGIVSPNVLGVTFVSIQAVTVLVIRRDGVFWFEGITIGRRVIFRGCALKGVAIFNASASHTTTMPRAAPMLPRGTAWPKSRTNIASWRGILTAMSS